MFLIPELVEAPAEAAAAAKKKPAKPKKGEAVIPPNPMDLLTQAVRYAAPAIARANSGDEGHHQLHLTIGQFDQTELESMRAQLQENWVAVEFEVTELSFISRDTSGDSFHTRQTIALPTD